MEKLLKIKFITYGYLLILLLGTVLPLNSVSSALNDNYTLHIRWDYLLHALAYIPLPVLLGLCLKKGSWIWIVLMTLPVTVLLEVLQMGIPYRFFNVNDLVANGVGAIIGFIMIPIIRKLFFPPSV